MAALVATISAVLFLLAPPVWAGPPASPGTDPGQSPCPAGEALSKAGRFKAAEAAYLEAMKKPASVGCAAAGLAEMDRVERVCAGAAALASAGREAEAIKAYEEALKTTPQSPCAAKGIEDLNEGFFDDPAEASKTILSWVGLAALLLGGLAIVAAVALWFQTRIPGVRDLPPASWIRALRVGIESFDDTAAASHQGPALAALVRSKIESFGSESSSLRMIDSQAAIEETVLTKLGTINDQAKAVSAVMSVLSASYPRRQFQATGALQPEGKVGPGVSVSLRNGKELSGAATLWAQDFGLGAETGDAAVVERMQRLAVPAAAWISHATATAAGENPGGSTDPVSWALFKTANEWWDRDGDTATATRLYEKAIGIDPENWGALARLGTIENDKGDYAAAIEHLRKALKVLET